MASGMKLDIDRVTRNLRFIAQGALPEFGRAMFDEIEEKETPECAARTPVDTGALKSTVRTTGPVLGPKTVKVGTTAGGPTAPYAVKVHEDTEVYHRVGQAKFIESTYRESAPFLLERVAKRANLGKLVKK